MYTFEYVDNTDGKYENGQWTAPIIFSCQASSITKADELYKNATGFDPAKQPHIGVAIT